MSNLITDSIKKGDILLTDDVWYYVESDPAFKNSGYFYVPRAIADISYDYKNYTDEQIMEQYIKDNLGGIRRAVEEKLQKYADNIRKKWKIEKEGLLMNAIYKTSDGSYIRIFSKESDGVIYQELEATPSIEYRVKSGMKRRSKSCFDIVERVE